MSAAASPFTDPAVVRGQLYGSADRLARRTGALHRARVSGRHAGLVIAELAASAVTQPGTQARIADIGCGRGTTTSLLVQRFPAASVLSLDISPALLAAARGRLPAASDAVLACADFHHLPLAEASCDLIVAAFCLYHSPAPRQVISEITRCLRPGSTAIVTTKSAGSYRELDHLVSVAGLDPDALSRPGLYQSAHSGNLPALVSGRLRVQQVLHHPHRFTFTDLGHAAEYLVTSPKYHLPTDLARDAAALASALRDRLPDRPVTATSTVTYLTATRPAADAITAPAAHRKSYHDDVGPRRAEQNYRWLASLGGPMRLPRLLAAESRQLVFEHVDGRHAQPSDLRGLASHLGAAHASAYAAQLRHARLAEPFRASSGHRIPGFLDTRLAGVARELGSGAVPRPAFTTGQAARLLRFACDGPAAFYKDSNPRNFLITPAGPVSVDFDDLTLAPFGYDLAKLVMTLAMTYGPLPGHQITAAVDAYNTACRQHPGTGTLTWRQLMDFAEIHHILTARYLGRAGYRHSWDTMRPDRRY